MPALQCAPIAYTVSVMITCFLIAFVRLNRGNGGKLIEYAFYFMLQDVVHCSNLLLSRAQTRIAPASCFQNPM
jgi:hypothetical protein